MPERAPILPWHTSGTAYASLAPTWRRSVDRYGLIPNPPQGHLRALDAGCGTGYGAQMLSAKGYAVTAFDKWPGFALYAKCKGIGFLECGFADFDLRSFDVVCCFEVIEHLDMPPGEAVQRLASWVNPSGTVYVSVPINHPDTQWHRHIFPSSKELRTLWEPHFTVQEYHAPLNVWTLRLSAPGDKNS